MSLVAGRIFSTYALFITGALVLYMIYACRNGKINITLRRMAGLDAIEEAIGRATEMGKPVHYSVGIADIQGETAPQTYAGLECLAYVTGLCAKYNAELIVTIRIPNVFPLAQEVVRQGYMGAGKADLMKEDTVRFLSSDQFAYAAGAQGIMHREKVAANIMLGGFWAESLFMAEAGAQIGAIQIAGTANMHQIPFFVAACDYALIGEELFAGGAYLSQDKVKLGSIAAQDYIKIATFVFVLVGALMRTAGNTFLFNMLGK
jgi:hypothetical protein